MADKTIEKQLLHYFQALARPEQENVLNYLRSLLKNNHSGNQNLLKLSGTISENDIELMSEAIREGCEKVDKDEW